MMMRFEEIMIPPYFRCPISLDIFKDPVTLWTGQTYDRCCIEKWLAAGNSTCPVTMQKLHDSSMVMVPNHTLRHLIHDWLQSNSYSPTQCSSLHDFSQDQISVARIKHIIESDAFPSEQKLRALEELHSLSQQLPLDNSIFITLNFFQTLIENVFRNVDTLMLVEKYLSSALKLMPFSDLKCLNILKQEPENAVFLSLLEEGTMFIKKALCLVVEAVSSEQQLCQKLGESSRAVRAIVRVVQQREEEEAVEAGIRALLALSSTESSLGNIASQGAVEALVGYLSDVEARKRSVAAAAAMSAVEKLMKETSARRVLVNHAQGVRAVVKMVFRVCEHEGSESAVNSLLILCAECQMAREKVIGDGVLTQLLLLLQSQSSARTKAKGRMLLKMLRSK